MAGQSWQSGSQLQSCDQQLVDSQEAAGGYMPQVPGRAVGTRLRDLRDPQSVLAQHTSLPEPFFGPAVTFGFVCLHTRTGSRYFRLRPLALLALGSREGVPGIGFGPAVEPLSWKECACSFCWAELRLLRLVS